MGLRTVAIETGSRSDIKPLLRGACIRQGATYSAGDRDRSRIMYHDEAEGKSHLIMIHVQSRPSFRLHHTKVKKFKKVRALPFGFAYCATDKTILKGSTLGRLGDIRGHSSI